ncbi:flagellar biosynthesis protein FlhB [Novosphingobium flavum]|uniref:Flagellar biosynthesis protein FlhB n=1 Tax=Novosphingobium aerophilum TaxID=2839843 RepID=A0A7X1F8U6_9SPHN|nr:MULTISPECIES: flagellar type III secretion system protein FlhB [Novosphingobium]MBC2652124.1 flagellar biosynthesis protein FlhB [Novosphingobium aerophilum]MBC2661081.1 flagellar biosynthesis protein FlhB [Novosphingobium aerophilum]
MNDDGGEKTLAPTEKRKRDAAREGDVLRSRELSTAVAMLAGAAWLKLAGPWMFGLLTGTLAGGLRFGRAEVVDFAPGAMMLKATIAVAPPVLVLGVMVAFASIASQLGFGEGRWIGTNLLPKGSRMNPLSGLKRMFGTQGLVELGKSLAKAGLLGAITYSWARDHLGGLIDLARAPLSGQLVEAWDAITSLLFALTAGLVLIAMIDFPIQWVRRFLRLRMSLQEVKDEHKESEGSPERKAAIRQRQRQLAMGSMQKVMREAQFVLTNPTHFSVAMVYDPDKAAAPIVLAKGRGEKALAMRELAREFDVPLLEYPALARSVYFTTRENQVIREELYAAVAGVLGFVMALKRGETRPMPRIEVPLELRFDPEGRPDPVAA